MALDAEALAMLMKNKLDALPAGTVGEPNLKALAEAVVEHITANALVSVSNVTAGNSIATGGLS